MALIAWCALALPVQPSVPEDVEPKEPHYLGDPRAGRFIIPEGIRPALKEFRIEVRCLPPGRVPRGCRGWAARLGCAEGRAGEGAGLGAQMCLWGRSRCQKWRCST